MVEVKNLTKNYIPEFSALLNINFKSDMRPVVIIGDEGAGKTTLLNIIAGLDLNYSGSILINDVERREIKNEENFISYITAEPTLFLNKSVYKNLEYVFKVKNKKFDKDQARKEIKAVAEEFNLFGILNKRMSKCSLFEKKLVCVARAVLKNSRLILADEPLKGLIGFEKAGLLQALFSAISKLSSDLIVSEKGENLTYFNGCQILNLDFGVQK